MNHIIIPRTLTCLAKIRRAWKCEVWPFLRHVILLRSPPGAPATIIQDGIMLMPVMCRYWLLFDVCFEGLG